MIGNIQNVYITSFSLGFLTDYLQNYFVPKKEHY